MMLRVNDEYLDFDDTVDVERQVKLFEELSTTDGDFSYSFELQKTINNVRILGNPQPDNINKPVYQRIYADLLNDSGSEVYRGYIRVEKISQIIQCSFFAGNNNWFGLLAGNLRDLDWSEYDTENTESNVSAAIFNTEGVVFPWLDNGVLSTRGSAQFKVEDFVSGIYVKDVFRKIFTTHGIKLEGDLFNDADFNSAITLSSPKNKEFIDARSTYARSYSTPNPESASVYNIIHLTDDSNYPYFDGSANNFDTSTYRYTADVKMRVHVEFQVFDFVATAAFYITKLGIFKNGVLYKFVYAINTLQYPSILTVDMVLEAGDYIDARILSDDPANDFTIVDPLTNVTLKVTPTYLYYSFGSNIVPDWTQQKYVSNVLRAYNVLSSYNPATGTLTMNLFEKIGSRTSVDISQYISETEIDYTEFVSAYGKKTLLSHHELTPDDEFLKMNFNATPYSKGVIDVDNEFLQDSADAVTLDFMAPISYVNPIFKVSTEKTDLISLDEEVKVDFTGVSSGTLSRARFAVDDTLFAISDLVRIQNSTNPRYNGDWMIFSTGSGWIEFGGLTYDTNATGEASKMNFVYGDSDSVFLLHQVPLYTVSKYSSLTSFKLEATDYETTAPAFYSIMDQGLQVSTDFIYSMSFVAGDQLSLIDQYFRMTSRVLNDPVKLFCTAYLPLSTFLQLDMLSPVKVLTEETQNRYYINRITGYKESFLPCTLELIKLP